MSNVLTQTLCLILLASTLYVNFSKLEYLWFLQSQYQENILKPAKIFNLIPYVGIESMSLSNISKYLVSSFLHDIIVIFWNIQDRININYFVFVSHLNLNLIIFNNIISSSAVWQVYMLNTVIFLITSYLLFFHYIENNRLKYMVLFNLSPIICSVLWLFNF